MYDQRDQKLWIYQEIIMFKRRDLSHKERFES